MSFIQDLCLNKLASLSKEENAYFKDVEKKSLIGPSAGFIGGVAGVVGGHSIAKTIGNNLVDTKSNTVVGRTVQGAGAIASLLSGASLEHRIRKNNLAEQHRKTYAELDKQASEYYTEKGYTAPVAATAVGAAGLIAVNAERAKGVKELEERAAKEASKSKLRRWVDSNVKKPIKTISEAEKPAADFKASTESITKKLNDFKIPEYDFVNGVGTQVKKSRYKLVKDLAPDVIKATKSAYTLKGAVGGLSAGQVGRRAAVGAVIPTALIAAGLGATANTANKNAQNSVKNDLVRSKIVKDRV